jgi:hypothetical protein
MEERAPYGSKKPQANPPDLAAELLPALERLGFVVQHLASPTQTLLTAAWLTQEGQSYQLLYTHFHPASGPHISEVNLRVLGRHGVEVLVADTHVRKVSQVRLLLLCNARYKAARQAALAAGTLHPAQSPHTD